MPGSSLEHSDRLIRQLDNADILLIATPMHNYSLPSALKAWIDHIVRIRVTFEGRPQGKVGLLRDRPVYCAISSGGIISWEQAWQPDFLRPYLSAALATVGLHQLQFFTIEGATRGEGAMALEREKAQQEESRAFSKRALQSPEKPFA